MSYPQTDKPNYWPWGWKCCPLIVADWIGWNFRVTYLVIWEQIFTRSAYLLFWPTFNRQVFLEKKNSAGCLLKTKWLMQKLNIAIWRENLCSSENDQQAKIFFSKKLRQMKAGQNNKYDIAKSWNLCSRLVNLKITSALSDYFLPLIKKILMALLIVILKPCNKNP